MRRNQSHTRWRSCRLRREHDGVSPRLLLSVPSVPRISAMYHFDSSPHALGSDVPCPQAPLPVESICIFPQRLSMYVPASICRSTAKHDARMRHKNMRDSVVSLRFVALHAFASPSLFCVLFVPTTGWSLLYAQRLRKAMSPPAPPPPQRKLLVGETVRTPDSVRRSPSAADRNPIRRQHSIQRGGPDHRRVGRPAGRGTTRGRAHLRRVPQPMGLVPGRPAAHAGGRVHVPVRNSRRGQRVQGRRWQGQRHREQGRAEHKAGRTPDFGTPRPSATRFFSFPLSLRCPRPTSCASSSYTIHFPFVGVAELAEQSTQDSMCMWDMP
jgi:hypothetical protein